MNIVSAMVGVSIAAMAAPSVLQMTLAPVEAQARARNFTTAESSAVSFSSNWEGKDVAEWTADDVPDNCDAPLLVGERAYDITCWGGDDDSKYRQVVTRSFRLAPEVASQYTNPNRQFAWETPKSFSHVECPSNDPWGVGWYNEHLAAGHLDACIPSPVWSEQRYLESSPDDWLYDLSFWGYGVHPDF